MIRDPDSIDSLTAALAYARRGWPVVPVHPVDAAGFCGCGNPHCRKPGKHPTTEHGLSDATCDEPTIRAWWENNPDANVAVLVGPKSGLLAIDVDPRHGGDASLAALEAEHGPLPTTVRSRTGGGGSHYLYRLPENVGGQCEPAPGVETYANDHLLVAPESLHASGRRYAWEPGCSPDECELADPPAWIIRALSDATAKPSAKKEEPSATESDGAPILSGSRHKALIRLAGALRRRGLSCAAIEAALTITNFERCRPQLETAEIEEIARDIGAKPVEQDVAGQTVTADARVATILKSAETALALVSDETVVEPPSMIGEGLAPRGSTLMLAGQGGAGKTWTLLYLALAIVRAALWLGLRTTLGRVGIISFEMPRWALRKRLLMLSGNDRSGLENIVLLGREMALGLKLPADTDIVARFIRDNRLDVAIVDPFASIQETPGDNGEAIGPTLEALIRLGNDTQAVIIAAHHVPKPTGRDKRDPIDMLRGHSRLRDDVDAVLVIERVDGLRRLTFAKIRHGIEPEPIWIDSTGQAAKAPEKAIGQRERNVAAVRALFEQHGERAFTAEEIAAAVVLKTPAGAVVKPATIRDYCRALTTDGALVPVRSGDLTEPKAWRLAVVVTTSVRALQHNGDA